MRRADLSWVLRLAGVVSASTNAILSTTSSRVAMNPTRVVRGALAFLPEATSRASASSRSRLIRSRPCFVSPRATGTTLSSTSTRRQPTARTACTRTVVGWRGRLGTTGPSIARAYDRASQSTAAASSETVRLPMLEQPMFSSPSTTTANVAGEEGAELAADSEVHRSPLKVNLLEMDEHEVEEFVKSLGEPKYRAKQVLKWMYQGGTESFENMTNIPKAFRMKLARVATVAAKQTSKDGTKKVAYRLADGQLIESVLMPYSDGRRTACISSQAGCGMGCVFCATGQMGFKRQLSSSEIFEQAYQFSQELAGRGDRLSNVVFMGMGEPLANYNNVMEAVRRMNRELGIGARHITISTVGLVPRIVRLSQEDIQVKLAVSLHAANDRERGALIPVNRRFPLSELMDACREYVNVSGRRMTFEWALIQGKNDSAEVAAELGRLLRPLKGMCHVNIIPLNPTAGYKGGPSMADAVSRFVEVLSKHGVPATPRMRRGIDIDAGCGQLTVKVAQDNVLGKGL